jgi:TolB protein
MQRDILYLMDADGSNRMRPTNNSANETDPAWSPDGTRIAFFRDFEIYLIDPDGSNATNLTQNPLFDGGPAWTPR